MSIEGTPAPPRRPPRGPSRPGWSAVRARRPRPDRGARAARRPSSRPDGRAQSRAVALSPSDGAGRAGRAPARRARPPSRRGGRRRGLSLVDVRRLWPDILDAVKLKRRFTWILLSQHAQVADVDDTTLTIALANAGARNSFSSGGSEEILRQAAIDVIGHDWRVESIVDPSAQPGADPRHTVTRPRWPTRTRRRPPPRRPTGPDRCRPGPGAAGACGARPRRPELGGVGTRRDPGHASGGKRRRPAASRRGRPPRRPRRRRRLSAVPSSWSVSWVRASSRRSSTTDGPARLAPAAPPPTPAARTASTGKPHDDRSQNPFGEGGFDMNALLQQAQQMQEQMVSAQQELAEADRRRHRRRRSRDGHRERHRRARGREDPQGLLRPCRHRGPRGPHRRRLPRRPAPSPRRCAQEKLGPAHRRAGRRGWRRTPVGGGNQLGF